MPPPSATPATSAPLQVRLLKNRQRRLLAGHDWVFSNEIDPASLRENPPSGGELIHLCDNQNRFLASAWYNPGTLIAARVIDRRSIEHFSRQMLAERLDYARRLRDRIFPTPHYRWIYGDSDQLPGLVIDRFGEVLSVQITTAGMEAMRSSLLELLLETDSVRGIVVHNDLDFRRLEGLPEGPTETIGDVPGSLTAIEDGLTFTFPAKGGQKTGWFYDQRDNRQRLVRYAAGCSVADLYSYAGAWGIHAAKQGAANVCCVDSSRSAIEMVQANAAANQVEVDAVCADSLETLKGWGADKRVFDIVIIDPPALIKRRKDVEAGLQSYFQLNRLAARVVAPGGILVSCSCSHHLPEEELITIINHAAFKDGGRHAQILETGSQSADHPVHPAMPETRYLKCIFARLG